VAGQDLPAEHEAWALEAFYLAAGLANIVYTLSPAKIVLGGGVMRQRQLFPLIREQLRERLRGYIVAPELKERIDDFVVPPELGESSGVVGALCLAGRLLS
jgi:fructokinase